MSVWCVEVKTERKLNRQAAASLNILHPTRPGGKHQNELRPSLPADSLKETSNLQTKKQGPSHSSQAKIMGERDRSLLSF